MLKKISCACTTGCHNLRCGCLKHGLQCSSLCTNCDCINCDNFEKKDTDQDSEEVQTMNEIEEFPDVTFEHTEETADLPDASFEDTEEIENLPDLSFEETENIEAESEVSGPSASKRPRRH